MSTRTYNPSGHFTSATCIALLDRAPCQAISDIYWPIYLFLTRFYLSFDASLIECHKHFHSMWENNRAMSAKQRSACEDVYRVHDNGKVWPLLNFHELQTV